MDILGMLNDYLKNNKSEDQLANEFSTLLDKGQSIEKVAKSYEYSVEKVKEILEKSGYSYSNTTGKWNLNTPQKRDNIIQNIKSEEQLANEFISLLNKGQTIDGIVNIYNYPIEKVKQTLINAGYKNVVATYERKNSITSRSSTIIPKNSKTEEKLAEGFSLLLNKGQSLEKVAELHNLSTESVNEILNNAGYKYYGFSRKWKRINNLKQSKKKQGSSSVKLANNKNVNNSEKISSTKTSYETSKIDLKISLDIIVDLLNDGIQLEEVSKQYNVPSANLKYFLYTEGYNYYSFMNYWTKKNTEELSEYLVTELNQGFTIYDLSGKYTKSNKDRIAFVSEVENYLKLYGFNYDSQNKKWGKNITSSRLTLAINELNKGVPLKIVADKFNTTSTNLRLELKNAQYRYDPLFMVWTKESKKKLIEKLAKDLFEGNVTFKDLEDQDLNIKELEIELKHSGLNYTKPKYNNVNQQFSNETICEKLKRHPLITAEMLMLEEKEESFIFENDKNFDTTTASVENSTVIPNKELLNETEIAIIKEMIFSWKQKKEEKSTTNNTKVETTFFINSDLLSLLTKTSEQEGVSRSVIIEKALKVYFKK